METREWFEEWHRKNVDEPLQAAAAALHAAEEAARRAEENARQAAERERAAQQAAHEMQVQLTAQLFELRLGRPVTETERATLAERLRTLGQEQVGKVVRERSADAAAAWLAHPDAR